MCTGFRIYQCGRIQSYQPYILGDPDNFTPANPLVTRVRTQRFAYAILRSIPKLSTIQLIRKKHPRLTFRVWSPTSPPNASTAFGPLSRTRLATSSTRLHHLSPATVLPSCLLDCYHLFTSSPYTISMTLNTGLVWDRTRVAGVGDQDATEWATRCPT
jgi:hypothetical protein